MVVLILVEHDTQNHWNKEIGHVCPLEILCEPGIYNALHPLGRVNTKHPMIYLDEQRIKVPGVYAMYHPLQVQEVKGNDNQDVPVAQMEGEPIGSACCGPGYGDAH